nr:MAG TPA: hypothetical protein [Caudoviricetes sp.]
MLTSLKVRPLTFCLFILRMNDKRYSLAIKPAVVGSARYLSLCRRILTVESRLSKDRKEKSWRRVKNHV